MGFFVDEPQFNIVNFERKMKDSMVSFICKEVHRGLSAKRVAVLISGTGTNLQVKFQYFVNYLVDLH